MSELLRELAGFSGLVHDNMFRFAGWRFLTMGRALERGSAIALLLATYADYGAPAGSFDVALEVGDSVMTHRRRYSVETNRNTVIDLLALDGDNPRSIVFQVETLREQQALLPEGASPARWRRSRAASFASTPASPWLCRRRSPPSACWPSAASSRAISDALTARYLS